MPEAEGLALYRAGRLGAGVGPLAEIGSYCGKSSVYLGTAAAETGTVLFTVDHHRGSRELQPGWEHHDPSVVDPATGRIDTLPHLRRTIEEAELEGVVVAVVGDSPTVGRLWGTSLGLLFLDGGHGADIAAADYEAWAGHVARGGVLAIHDVFPDPADGGRPPYDVYRRALATGSFTEVHDAGEGSLRILRREA